MLTWSVRHVDNMLTWSVHQVDVILTCVDRQVWPLLYLRAVVTLSRLTMPPISEQFYDDEDDGDDETEMSDASDPDLSEGDARENEFKVSISLPVSRISSNADALLANAG